MKIADKTKLGVIRVVGSKKVIDVIVNDKVVGIITVDVGDKKVEEKVLNLIKLIES